MINVESQMAMDVALWISFVLTVTILVITPGPSVLLVVANSMKYGPSRTSGTILGDLSANLCQISLAAAGLASVVTASGQLFQIIKWCGVGYLIYIGVMKIIDQSEMAVGTSTREAKRSFRSMYLEGFMMSAANPKAIVFFAALFPLFIAPEAAFLPQVMILAATFLVLDCLALALYTRFAGRLKQYLENSKKVHLQNRIVGILLILSAVMLATVKKAR